METALNQRVVVRHVLSFLPDEFLFIAGVSQLFLDSWRESGLETRTKRLSVVSSASRAAWSVDSGLVWGDDLSRAAAKRPNAIEVLDWGLKAGHINFARDATWDLDGVCEAAAASGRLKTLQWLRANGCQWDERTCRHAAYKGHLELLQWAVGNGCPWSKFTSAWAASGGHMETLKWLHANGCPWDARACSHAAQSGHQVVVEWLHAQGCPWDEEACSRAAAGGHLTLLKWLRANGCPWDSDTCEWAVEEGDTSILEWIHANGCPCTHNGHDAEEAV